MGGNALAEGLTERKGVQDYLQIKALVLETLRRSDCGSGQAKGEGEVLAVVSEIVEMPEKQSFGDLDLLYVLADGKTREDLYKLIRHHFSPTDMVTHGSVTSFDFMRFQIDMIQCTPDSFAMSHFCLSYGDRGMILGQMAKCRGFSLGSKGLVVTHTSIEELLGYKNGHISSTEKIVLSTDPVAIREFMGLPQDNDVDSLTTQEDVMNFCMQSPWFRPQYFAPRKLSNCESKKKLRQRPFYKMFCEKIALEYNLGDTPPLSAEDKAADLNARLTNIREALAHFHMTERVHEIGVQQQKQQEVREKLDYKLFVALGIETRRVGTARSSFTQWLLEQQVEREEGDEESGHSSDNSDSSSSKENKNMRRELAVQAIVLRKSPEEVHDDMTTWFKEVWRQQEHKQEQS